jgi:hypothetical protein
VLHQVASHFGEEYYLYIIQNAHSNPNLIIIKDPFRNLAEYIQSKVVEEIKIVLYMIPEKSENIEFPL